MPLTFDTLSNSGCCGSKKHSSSSTPSNMRVSGSANKYSRSAVVISGVENAVLVGGLSAIGAALYSIGIPKDTVLQYESAG